MNNYYPTNYQPNYNQYQQPTSTGMVWVQGLEGAKAYPVASGNSVLLMDSEESVFYIKTSDQSGMPQPLRIFDYKERTAQPQAEYVTKAELDKALAELRRGKKKDE